MAHSKPVQRRDLQKLLDSLARKKEAKTEQDLRIIL